MRLYTSRCSHWPWPSGWGPLYSPPPPSPLAAADASASATHRRDIIVDCDSSRRAIMALARDRAAMIANDGIVRQSFSHVRTLR